MLASLRSKDGVSLHQPDANKVSAGLPYSCVYGHMRMTVYARVYEDVGMYFCRHV